MAIEIRVASAREEEEIRRITTDAYSQYESVMPAGHWRIYRVNLERTLDDKGDAEQLVATLGDKLVGTVLLYPPGKSFSDVEIAATSDDCPEVRMLAVAPDGRGQGVGRALMQECVARARRVGAPGIVLHTMSMMEAARAIYQSMGFEREPGLDFSPAEGFEVEGFRLDI